MLIDELSMMSEAYPGWSLTELKGLSPRERYLWFMKAIQRKLRTRGKSG